MSSANASLKVYNSLKQAGLKEEVAERLAQELQTRSETAEVLATKTDITAALHENTKWLVAVFIGIAFGQMAITITVMMLLLNFYFSAAGLA